MGKGTCVRGAAGGWASMSVRKEAGARTTEAGLALMQEP